MTEYSNADKRGYLDQGFRLFHLKDTLAQKLQPHYHEFDKIILPLGGRVTYVVEGVAYFLKPWDMLLVQHNLIHRVAIDPEEPYVLRRPGGRGSTCCAPTGTGGFSTCRRSSSWRRPCAPRSSAPGGWRILCASSCSSG